MTVDYTTPAAAATQSSPVSARLVKNSHSRQAQDSIEIGDGLIQHLTVSFQRTIRIPDGKDSSALPPSMGTFPLYPVTQYKDGLPSAMRLKGGLFFPMYRKCYGLASDERILTDYRTRGDVDQLLVECKICHQDLRRRCGCRVW